MKASKSDEELNELWELIFKKLNITTDLEEYYARLEEEEDPREDLPTLYDRNS